MSIQYKYDDKHIDFMREQVWEAKDDLDLYSRLSELEYPHFKDELPDNPKLIMDLGCGLGRAGIYLWHQIEPLSHFVFADKHQTDFQSQINPEKFKKSEESPRNKGGWDDGVFYNDLTLTESFVKLNGVKNFSTFDITKDDWSTLFPIDLVISMLSVGLHAPIEGSLPNLLKVCSENCTMIFGIKRPEQQLDEVTPHFKEWKIITGTLKPPYPNVDYLIVHGINK